MEKKSAEVNILLLYKEYSDFCFLTDHMAVTETVDIVQYSQRDVYIPHDYERGISHVT